MSISFIDYEIQENLYSTREMKNICNEQTRLQRFLDVEAALAYAEGETGIIPKEAAKEISLKANLKIFDMKNVKSSYKVNMNSIIPLINELKRICSEDTSGYVHYGATTQDIVDTALVLEAKDFLKVITNRLNILDELLRTLTSKHKRTVMIGRTHGQFALPITFGLKTAIWLQEMRRNAHRINSLQSRILVGQLTGAVGTATIFGIKGTIIGTLAMKKLGLKYTNLSWHNARDNMAELSSTISICAGTVGKIANEIFFLNRSDIQELHEIKEKDTSAGSSTMPHKNNPVYSERIIVLVKHIHALNNVVLNSMMCENERDPRSLWAEWLVYPQLFVYFDAALEYLIKILQNISINEKRMFKNLKNIGDTIVSEYLVFRLGKILGQKQAKKIIDEAMKKALYCNKSLKDILLGTDLGEKISLEDIYILNHPETYIGNSIGIVEKTLKEDI